MLATYNFGSVSNLRQMMFNIFGQIYFLCLLLEGKNFSLYNDVLQFGQSSRPQIRLFTRDYLGLYLYSRLPSLKSDLPYVFMVFEPR